MSHGFLLSARKNIVFNRDGSAVTIGIETTFQSLISSCSSFLSEYIVKIASILCPWRISFLRNASNTFNAPHGLIRQWTTITTILQLMIKNINNFLVSYLSYFLISYFQSKIILHYYNNYLISSYYYFIFSLYYDTTFIYRIWCHQYRMEIY